MTIVGNLVDNAFDAVAAGDGPRRVRVDARVEDGDAVLVVEDSGPGLPQEALDRAFERGYSTRRRVGRRGIGLALVAQSVQRLGGELSVEGHPAPASSCASPRGRREQQPRSSLGVLHVLVVEDEPVAAEAHTAYVERVPGFAVAATVATSQAALQALQEKQVDVVLLDMNLPDRHGLEVIRAMRAGGHRADVIAVTSARDLDVVRSAVSLGVVQYVLKPFVFATLRERLLAYRAYREQVQVAEQVGTQAEVDEVIAPAARRRRDAPAQGHERRAALTGVAHPPRGG